MIAGILLAAGQGKRFGTDKRLHPVAGQPLVCYALDAAANSRLASLYVVLGPGDNAVRETIDSLLRGKRRAHFIENSHPTLGMMSSLKAALQELPPECEGAIVVHADMPLVPSSLIDRLIDEFEEHDGIVVPESGGRWQHPRLIPRWVFEEFLSLGDDERGLGILETYSDRVTVVPMPDHRLFLDIDSPDDLEQVDGALREKGR